MSAIDRRTFLRGMLFGLLGAVLGWEVEAIAAEAAPEEEETPRGRTYYVGGGCDTNDGLSWKTRKATAAGLLHSGLLGANDLIIFGPSHPYPQRIIAGDPDSAVLLDISRGTRNE